MTQTERLGVRVTKEMKGMMLVRAGIGRGKLSNYIRNLIILDLVRADLMHLEVA